MSSMKISIILNRFREFEEEKERYKSMFPTIFTDKNIPLDERWNFFCELPEWTFDADYKFPSYINDNTLVRLFTIGKYDITPHLDIFDGDVSEIKERILSEGIRFFHVDDWMFLND